MNKLILFAIILISGISASAQTVEGKWKSIDDETGEAKSIVEIYEKDSKIYGRIIQLFRSAEEEQDPSCTECKGSKKGQKINGMEIMEGLVKDGSEYEDGTILDPNNGKVYDCKIWLEGDDKRMVGGWVGFFDRTQEWRRVE